MTVSIILPNYNHAPYLEERLDSILNQTYTNFELIILDDNSSDNSLDILQAFKSHKKVSHFIVNRKNSGSPFEQWKKGLDLAKGDYVWIAESDDKSDYDFLESQLRTINREQADIVVAATQKFNSKDVLGEVKHPIFRNKFKLSYTMDDILYCPLLNVSAMLCKTHLVKKAIFFKDFKLIGDRVFYHEAFYNCKFVFNTTTNSYFRKEGESVSTLKFKGIDYLKTYFKEHLRFIIYVYNDRQISKQLFNSYLTRFFNRVRHRTKRKEKFGFKFFSIYLLYIKNLKR
ncbi:glycosyltransferase family 2 protein [Mangrovimonas yunxiaonensis]|uniref:glycosyltransferase family 2 protein n=1 Tax=Mangrovimonas yunxiaonensis TaxID=1197477 RepID=UPI00068AE4B4|nr:glycosyltransferase family 2 protein [Mangrovimonas yunxiaonensis]GGH45975.1 hypothetical protein GCM10011364_19810 [Mangrovimonas yunxiaonensis]